MDKPPNINLRPTFNKNAEFLCIEYPGVVANASKMLATLGGPENIEKAYSDPTKRLDLRYRPDDPCCKPLCADKTSCISLVLRVSKYQRKKKDDGENNTGDEFMYRQHICGVASTTYKFTSLCDYQYLPLRRNERTNEMQNMIPSLKVDQSTLQNEDFFSAKLPIFLPPPTYGRLDKPFAYQYKKDHTNYRTKTARQKTTWENQFSSRKERTHNCILVHYEAKAPSSCTAKALEILNSASTNVKDAAEKIKKAFEDRPIWSRNALQGNTGIGMHALKIVIPVYAYYVVTGPWARLWVRFGYDPKTDPSAKKYQLIDFRLRQGMHTPYIPVKAKRSAFNYKMPQVSKKRTGSQPGDNLYPSRKAEASQPTIDRPSETSYIFEPGVLPAHRNIYYQICDINLPSAKEMIISNAATTCTKEEGWLTPTTTAQIRNLMTKDLYKTISLMQCGTPHEAPKELCLPEGTQSTSKETEPNQSEDLEGSDPDEELDDSSSSSEDDSLAERSQDDILAEAFSTDLDDVTEETFEDGEFFFEDDDQMLDSTMFNEDSVSK